jgi:type II secretory pathway pseudopilin PulG
MLTPATHDIGNIGMTRSRSRAFTLVELLVVISVMVTLMGVLTSVIAIAQRSAKQTKTRSTMMKVDQAVRMFRTEMGIYPFQTDLSTADTDPTKWTNNLAYRLAWKPADSVERATYLSNMQKDLDKIHACFVFKGGRNIGAPDGDGTHAFRFGSYYSPADPNFLTNILMESGSLKVPDAEFTKVNGKATEYIISGWEQRGTSAALVLTRMASEISVLRYISGQLPVEAPTGYDPADPADRAIRPDLDPRYTFLHFTAPIPATTYTAYRYVPYNKAGVIADDSRGPVLSTGAALAGGFRCDYLSDDFKRQKTAGGSGEIDVTGTAILDAYGQPLVYISNVTPGARGYSWASAGHAIQEIDYGMAPSGRTVTESMASDIRTTASQANLLEFEVWSKGRDRRFAEMRNSSLNNDNLSLKPYNKGLQ